MDEFAAVKRLALAAFSVACGWLFQFVLYLVLAPGASRHDRVVWAFWTGWFCLAGWIIVGLPIAITNPRLSSAIRIMSAAIVSGLIGVAMVGMFFRGLDLFFAPLAFLTASSSMLVYAIVGRALACDISIRR